MPLAFKLLLLLFAAIAALLIGVLIFAWTGSYFLVGCWCAAMATVLDEAQFGSRTLVERVILIAFVVGLVTIVGPMSV